MNDLNTNKNKQLSYIYKSIDASIKIKQSTFVSSGNKLVDIVNIIIFTLKNGNKLLICGNGGSAADAQHFAAELVGQFEVKRRALPAIALTTDTSILTSLANDIGYSNIFSRQVEALGNKDDVLFCITTSGNSNNIIKVIKTALDKNIQVIVLNGKGGGNVKELYNKEIDQIIVSNNNTARIQETHITLIHCICGLIDMEFNRGESPERLNVPL